MAEFDGRKVLVLGATGALGGGLAQAFVQAGAHVVGADRARPADDRAVAGVQYVCVDAGDDAALGGLFEAGAPPWAVINTIGGFAPHRPLTALDPEELIGQLRLNLLSAALITKHALRVMLPAGEGRIVHTASRAAVETAGSGLAYSVSKRGVLHLVAMAAQETRRTGITVNAVVPSIIDTPANRRAMPDADYSTWPTVPDIARAYLYLASPTTHLVSGAALPV